MVKDISTGTLHCSVKEGSSLLYVKGWVTNTKIGYPTIDSVFVCEIFHEYTNLNGRT